MFKFIAGVVVGLAISKDGRDMLKKGYNYTKEKVESFFKSDDIEVKKD